MKKFSILLSTVFALILVLNSPVFAAKLLIPTKGPYTVGAFGSTTPQSHFSIDEQPFAFIEFNRNTINTAQKLNIKWFWQHENEDIVSTTEENITSFPTNPLRLWNAITNWDLIKKPGEWFVQNEWSNAVAGTKGGFGAGLASFTVTPEPISTVLFLVGGAPLALRLYRKRQTV